MAKDIYILGINAYHADASAVLLKNGQLIAAVEEERFSRIKHSAGFPALAVRSCLAQGGIGIGEVDHIGVARVPSAQLLNNLTFVLHNRVMFANQGLDRLRSVAKIRDIRTVLTDSLGVRQTSLRAEFHNLEHHVAHMASSFLVSPFESAAVLSIDGFGDFCSTMLGYGTGQRLEKIDSVLYPHSLGLFYNAVTQYLGFDGYGDEGKVMGLAPYGNPRYLEQMLKVVRPAADGAFELDLDYFTHHVRGVEMTWDEGAPYVGQLYSDKLTELFGAPRERAEDITQHHWDVAASLQSCLEFHLFRILNRLYQRTGSTNLCLAGGVAYNSVANGRIRQETPFRDVFIQPAAGDSGTAIGVAYHIWNVMLGNPRSFVMSDVYLGPEYGDAELERTLKQHGGSYERCDNIAERAADLLAAGKIVGWFQGRMEFGPRALGNRSILADPRQVEIKDVLNRRIKHRESFRPFAPAVLDEYVEDYFEEAGPSPFMLMVFKVRAEKRPSIPAIEHVDHTGRIQSVSKGVNPRFWSLIDAFRRRTGIPMVLNTSFNENEPIVCSPQDALDCYTTTHMDALAIGDYLLVRS
jgi:carbamoyltransferase